MTLKIKAIFALPLLIKATSFSHMTEKKSTKINSVMHIHSFCFAYWIIAFLILLFPSFHCCCSSLLVMLPHKTKLFFDVQAMISLNIDDLMENA